MPAPNNLTHIYLVVNNDMTEYLIIHMLFTNNATRLSSGLNYSDASKLRSYLHFSEPRNLQNKSLLEIANLTPSIDFLDPLIEDIPKGI